MEIQDYIQTYINYNIGALIVSAPLIIVPPKSGKRIFKPNLNEWTDPLAWSGEYDSKYDNSK